MDWSIFHWLNDATRGNDTGQDAAEIFNTWAIIVLVVGAGVLWLLARPGGSLQLKLATASAAASAVVGLVAHLGLSKLWDHHPPFVTPPKPNAVPVHHARDK